MTISYNEQRKCRKLGEFFKIEDEDVEDSNNNE